MLQVDNKRNKAKEKNVCFSKGRNSFRKQCFILSLLLICVLFGSGCSNAKNLNNPNNLNFNKKYICTNNTQTNNDFINNEKEPQNIIDSSIVASGHLIEPRSNPFVAKLPDDKILIWGGYKEFYQNKKSKYGSGPNPKQYIELDTAEIYDIKTQKSKIINSKYNGKCLGIYYLENGNILLLSKDSDCQIFNSQNEKFEKAYSGIKLLPDMDVNEKLFFLKQNDKEIFITSSHLKNIIKLNVYTGEYELVYDNLNTQYITAIPIDSKKILCFGKLNQKTYKCLSKELFNSKCTNKSCGTVSNDIYIFDIDKLSKRKIGSIANDNLYLDFIKISNNKFLLYTNNRFDKNFIKKILKINKNSVNESSYDILINQDNRSWKPIKVSENLIFFGPYKVFNTKDKQIYKIAQENEINKEEYSNLGLASFMSPINKSMLLLDSKDILVVGGNNWLNAKSNNSIGILRLKNE